MGKLEGSGNFDVLASLYHIEVRLQEGKGFHHKLSSLPSSRPESWGVGSNVPCKDVAGGPELGGMVLQEGLA